MALRQRAILHSERMAGSRINHVRRRNGQRPMEAPCHEQMLTLRMNVRQPSSILGHALVKDSSPNVRSFSLFLRKGGKLKLTPPIHAATARRRTPHIRPCGRPAPGPCACNSRSRSGSRPRLAWPGSSLRDIIRNVALRWGRCLPRVAPESSWRAAPRRPIARILRGAPPDRAAARRKAFRRAVV